MAKLRDLKVTIGLSKKGLTKLNADLRRTKSNFRRNFGEISALASKVGGAIAAGIGAGLTAVIKSGAQLQKTEVGFRSLMGSAEGASKMVAQLNKFTAQTPFRLEAVATSARQLLAVGVGMDEINGRLQMLGDIAAASGNEINEIAAIFAKVQAKGKVELENLNQLAERSVPIFDQLRKVTGDANMEFGAGAVSVEQFNAALEQMNKEGGFANDAMVNLSETVDGRLSTALDNVNQALGKFAERSGILDAISNILDDATRALQDMSMTEEDVQQSREALYDLTLRQKDAHQGNAQALREEYKALEAVLRQQKQALRGTDAGTGAERVLNSLRKQLDILDEAMAFGTLPAAPAVADPVAVTEKETKAKKELIDVSKSQLKVLGNLDELQTDTAVNTLAAVYANHQLKGSVQELAEAQEVAVDMSTQLNGVFNFMSNTISAAFANIRDKSQGFHVYMKELLMDLLKRAVALAATFAAMAVLFPDAKVVSGGLGKFMAGGFGIPQMAEGGLFTGASLAMVGEGPGTSMINPEVVAPLDKLQQMMGGGNVTVTGRLDGRDILISSERAGFDRNRVRGF